MNYSRRQLYALGEPLGDGATRRGVGRKIVFGGGGSAPAQPSTQTVNNVNIPEYARPYVEDMLGRSQALTTQNTYQPYTGQRVAGPTWLQNESYGAAGSMTPSPMIGGANGIVQAVNNDAASQRYTPGTNTAITPINTQSQSFIDPNVASSYMNPYMQQVVDIQKREAIRNSDMQGQRDNAQAVGAGAFGGTRQALVDAERERNLGTQLNDIQAQGGNAAFQNAQQAFMQDQQRGLQSQMANQQAGLTAAGQNLQSQMANQQAGLGFGQQYLTAQQLGEQSRQFGAGYGLNALGQELQAGNLLQGVGQNQFNQQMGIAGLQNQFGTQQQAQQQQLLDSQMQDFANRQEFPYRNLEFMSGLIHGLPLTQTASTMYQAPPSPFSQLAGLGTAAYGASRLMMKKGGLVKRYADGGVTDVEPKGSAAGLADLLISTIQ